MKQLTMAEMATEEKASRKPAAKVNVKTVMKIPQTRIALKETGITYNIPPVSNRRELEKFFVDLNSEEAFEKFTILAVNSRCIPIAVYSILGSLDQVSAYPRVVAAFALMSNAHSVFFCHNHPGGTNRPSAEDISSTLQLQRVLRGIDVNVLDHIIIADGNAYSMASHGDIDFMRR